MHDAGKILMILGILIVAVGVYIYFGGRIPKVPGDIYIERDGFSFYFPLGTSILLSILLTLLFKLFF